MYEGHEERGIRESGGRRRAAGRILAVALCASLALSSAGTALAQPTSRQTASVGFVEQRPGVPTALTFSVDYVNPDNPGGKPPAVRTVVETLANDARFDTTVPAQCPATDAQLVAMGEAACPPGSKVGTGFIRIDTGFPQPNRFLEVDVTFFNNADQLIFLNTSRANGARVVARGTIQGGRLTSNAPPLPGTPPDGGAIDVVQTRLEKISREIGGVPRGYITTPTVCPPGGGWTNTLSFTYADGVTQTVASPSACVPPAGEISGLAVKRTPLVAAGAGPQVMRVPSRRLGFGTTVFYRINLGARVSFVVDRASTGRREGNQCLRRSSSDTTSVGCRRYIRQAGSIDLTALSGYNSFYLRGRLMGRSLPRGNYRLLATPSANGQVGPPASVKFAIS
jgi:hypothetical protein